MIRILYRTKDRKQVFQHIVELKVAVIHHH